MKTLVSAAQGDSIALPKACQENEQFRQSQPLAWFYDIARGQELAWMAVAAMRLRKEYERLWERNTQPARVEVYFFLQN